MAKESYAVIGLGQFGISIVNELIALGKDVLAIDNDPDQVKRISDVLPTAFVCDSTDEVALNQVEIRDAEYVVIAYGDNLEATILTTVLLKDMGVKHLIVRVDNPQYINIIKKLGAEEIISPQQAAGIALANRIGNEDYKDFYKLDKKFSIVSIEVNQDFSPRPLQEMNTKNLFGVSLVLVKRENTSFVPSGKDNILPGDNLFVVGTRKEVRAFREALNGKKRIW
ncbi:MAG: TrkA family potassium uptake protein [Erysipelotrichaceae bacterium]|nr:TrkA family potassium uptake protein [Erysipelotrichaceae bacterium]